MMAIKLEAERGLSRLSLVLVLELAAKVPPSNAHFSISHNYPFLNPL